MRRFSSRSMCATALRPLLARGGSTFFAVCALSLAAVLAPVFSAHAKGGSDDGSGSGSGSSGGSGTSEGHGSDDSGRGGGGSESGKHGGDDKGDRDTGSASDDGGHGHGSGHDAAEGSEPGDIGSNDDDLTDDQGGGDDDGGSHGGRGRDGGEDEIEDNSGHGGSHGGGDEVEGAAGGGAGRSPGRAPGRARFEGGRDFEPDVVLAADLSQGALGHAIALGFHVSGSQELRSIGLTVTRLEVPGGLDAATARDELATAEPGLLVDLNFSYGLAQGGSSACSGVRCFGRTLIRWPDAACDRPAARIGMLDTAIDARAPALHGSSLVVQRFGTGTPGAAETLHGTAIAAELVGAPGSDFPGLVPGATLVAADVFQAGPDARLDARTEQVVAALDWLAQQKPVVINASFAGPDSPLLGEAVRRVIALGIPIVAAAGNEGPDASPRYPAAFEPVIAVTAVDRFLHVYPRANRGGYVDVAAPGVGIWTTDPDGAGEFRDGTSFAAPYVTAQVAALRTLHPELQGDALLEALDSDALDLGAPGRDEVFGRGLARAQACVAP